MKFAMIRRTSVALPLIALLVLAGCGGGSNLNTGTDMPLPPKPPTDQERIEDAVKRAEAALASAMSAAEDAQHACSFLSTACAAADAANEAVTAAEAALADARAATTPADAEAAATTAETASGTAETAASTAQQAIEAPVGPAPAPGMVADGLAASAAPGMTATDSTTLETLFSSQPGNMYSPVSGGLKRDFTAGVTTLDGVLHVHTIQRTSAGGYAIVYTDGQTMRTVEFRPEGLSPSRR